MDRYDCRRFSDLRPIDQPLIRYRIHGSQQVGFVNKLEQRAPRETRGERHWQRVAESAGELGAIMRRLIDDASGKDEALTGLSPPSAVSPLPL